MGLLHFHFSFFLGGPDGLQECVFCDFGCHLGASGTLLGSSWGPLSALGAPFGALLAPFW